MKYKPGDIVVPIAKEFLPEDWQQCDKFVILSSEYSSDLQDPELREVHWIYPHSYPRPDYHRIIFEKVDYRKMGVSFSSFELYRWTP